MGVFRIEKNKNYTTMSNYHLRDISLSYKAKGLLSFMLSLPETWDYSVNGLVCVSKENIHAIRSILKELENHKYLVREKYQNDKGRFEYNYSIYEVPYDQLPYTENTHMVNPYTEKQPQINTNKEIIKKEITNQKDIKDKQIDKENIKYHPLVNDLIKSGFIDGNDKDMYRYSNLIYSLKEEYEYYEIIRSIKYILDKWKENEGLDENKEPIKNKYSCFKTALYNNLSRKEISIEDFWF